MTRRIHHPHQLAAALTTSAVMSIAMAQSLTAMDGPAAAEWQPFGAVFTMLWCFSLAWVAIALVLSARDAWRAWRSPRRGRYAPVGTGRVRRLAGPTPGGVDAAVAQVLAEHATDATPATSADAWDLYDNFDFTAAEEARRVGAEAA